MKKIGLLMIGVSIVLATACQKEVKQEQSIYFEEIPPQIRIDGSVRLNAAASSGLPVTFVSADERIATIEGDRAVFHAAGRILVYAIQPGNEDFYEAPDVFQYLLIKDWDPNKENQVIDFELPEKWQISKDGQMLKLNAVASSGLPIKYTLQGDEKTGHFLNASTFYVYHGGEVNNYYDGYDLSVSIVASQEGNDEYNPAENVARRIRIIGDVLH
jgi:hypothetical protein